MERSGLKKMIDQKKEPFNLCTFTTNECASDVGFQYNHITELADKNLVWMKDMFAYGRRPSGRLKGRFIKKPRDHMDKQIQPEESKLLLEKGWTRVFYEPMQFCQPMGSANMKTEKVKLWISPTGERCHSLSKIARLSGIEEVNKPSYNVKVERHINPKNILQSEAKRTRKQSRPFDPYPENHFRTPPNSQPRQRHKQTKKSASEKKERKNLRHRLSKSDSDSDSDDRSLDDENLGDSDEVVCKDESPEDWTMGVAVQGMCENGSQTNDTTSNAGEVMTSENAIFSEWMDQNFQVKEEVVDEVEDESLLTENQSSQVLLNQLLTDTHGTRPKNPSTTNAVDESLVVGDQSSITEVYLKLEIENVNEDMLLDSGVSDVADYNMISTEGTATTQSATTQRSASNQRSTTTQTESAATQTESTIIQTESAATQTESATTQSVLNCNDQSHTGAPINENIDGTCMSKEITNKSVEKEDNENGEHNYSKSWDNFWGNPKYKLKKQTVDDDFSVENPKYIIKNKDCQKNSSIYSLSTLPPSLMLSSSEDEHGLGIFASKLIPAFTQFGPVEGILVVEDNIDAQTDITQLWILPYEDISTRKFLDTRDENTSNWCRYLRPVGSENYNLLAIAREDGIYFVTTRNISVGEELGYRYPLILELLQKLRTTSLANKCIKKTCDICHITFHTDHDSCKHKLIFHPQKNARMKTRCSLCQKLLCSGKQIRQHFQEEHGSRVRYSCRICHKHFASLHILKTHEASLHEDETPKSKLMCPKCNNNKIYRSLGALKEHTKLCFQRACPTCGKLIRGYAMQRHLRTHSETGNRKFACDKCGKLFRDMYNLRCHYSVHHSNVKPFQCQVPTCDTGFACKSALLKHYMLIHGYTEENMPVIRKVLPEIQGYDTQDGPIDQQSAVRLPFHK